VLHRPIEVTTQCGRSFHPEQVTIPEELQGYRQGRREGGTGGGWSDFAKDIELMYSISFYGGHAYLDVAVLMRIVPGYTQLQSPRPEFLEPPPGASDQGGGGGSMGKYMFHYDSGIQILYMNHEPLRAMDKSNIVLLDDAEHQPPKIAATDSINGHLGIVDLGTQAMDHWHLTLRQRLQDLLTTSKAVREFIGL